MGDKSPRSKDKTKKQATDKKSQSKAEHDKKQAKPVVVPKGK